MTDHHSEASLGNAGWAAIIRTGQLGQFSLLCLGIWLHAADTMLVATAMPAAVAEIGGDRLVSWTLSLYLLGSILSGAAAALTASALGLRRAFVLAALTYSSGCVVSALAPDMIVMLIGRFAQGVGGGMLVALTYVAIQRLFPKDMWPRLIALMSAIWGASAFCGPLIGGFFADLGLWRWGFWMFAAQALLLAVLVPAFMRPSKGEAAPAQRFPVVRLTLLSLAVLSVATAGIYVTPAVSLPLVAAGGLFFYLFLRRDGSRGSERMFPTRAFDIRTPIGAGFIANLSLGTAAMSFTVYGPFLLNRIHGISALEAGYIIAAESVAWSTTAIAFAGVGAVGEKVVMRTGALMIVLAIAMLGPIMAEGPIWAILAMSIAQGAGFGLLWGFLIRRVVAMAPEQERDSASAAMPTTQQIAFALGAALAGIVANMAGFADSGNHTAMQNVAWWVFVSFVPVAALGAAAAWRVAGPMPAAANEGQPLAGQGAP
ncbi:MFS transporter [Nitratireductor pacificus]|uniref:Putative multidrug-efflux transporter n=1 Tax=Nitratireductor pacificus pht-3B TaxID=391937 RepID=K2M9R0_9HYPH|nr:MFS transporter [Nitratireductor pacificus]EKF17735.1 putative multidrug-efflux transporter [Nitratireductor pacificus pht-3B]